MSQNASVSVVENPHTDEITVAYSRLDYLEGEVSLHDQLRERLERKVAKYQRYAAEAVEALEAHDARRDVLAGELTEAHLVLDGLLAADPELAAEVQARREAAKAARLSELRAELARLEGN
jgi:chromosome segregation ATPase